MSKKKSEAAILSLIDSFSKAGLTTIDNDSDHKSQISSDTEENTNAILQKGRKLKTAEQLITIAPNKCRPWAYADRLTSEMGNIEDLATSIKNHGQQEPILVRPIEPDNNGVEFEIIFGNRRWRACSLIGKSLKAIVKPLTDQEAAICQKEENENREGLSDYSRAISYKRLLDAGIFANAAELSARMNVSKSFLSNLMSYNRIHPEIIKAMPDPSKLKIKSATKLATFSENIRENTLKAIVALAPQINSGKISANRMHQHIQDLIDGKENNRSKALLIKDRYGKPLFTSTIEQNGNMSIVFYKTVRENIPRETIEEALNDLIECYLKNTKIKEGDQRSTGRTNTREKVTNKKKGGGTM